MTAPSLPASDRAPLDRPTRDWPTLDWPTQLADTLLAWALTAQPALAPTLQAALHRSVQQLEAARSAGHVCLPLGPAEAAKLRASGLVEDDPERPQGRPLVLDGAHRLYLHRDFDHERALARRVAALHAAPPSPIDPTLLRSLFPPAAATEPGTAPNGPEGPDWQAVAVAQALRQRLTVICGGPGTGKTSTVVKLLACVRAAQPQARIGLAAPTGKAAQRLLDALRDGAQRLSLPPLALPQEALTVHRLLGAGPQGFRHGPENPLPLDWLVVDEASMLDLALARQVFDALGPTTRLVLLGDRHQLAAVENGAVLAELSRSATWTAASARALASALGRELPLPLGGDLPDLAVHLHRSHRFAAHSGIGALAAAVREGQPEQALAVLAQAAPDLHPLRAQDLPEALRAGFAPYAQALVALWESAEDGPKRSVDARAAVWRAWAGFRALCAGHGGPGGTRALNQAATQALRASLPAGAPPDLGQALLVTRNSPSLGLVNGDILLLLPNAHGALQAHAEHLAHPIPLDQLPEGLDGAFALTVHKAQGSEFDRVLLVVPDGLPWLSREWLYTGLTRARRNVQLMAGADALRQAIRNPTERHSGLRAQVRLVGGAA